MKALTMDNLLSGDHTGQHLRRPDHELATHGKKKTTCVQLLIESEDTPYLALSEGKAQTFIRVLGKLYSVTIERVD